MESFIHLRKGKTPKRLHADLDSRDPELDLYHPENPNQPPYTTEFLDRYRQATPARLQAEAARALQPTRRLALSVVPQRRVALALEGSAPVSVA